MAEAAVLLDADSALIRKGQEIGLRELTANLAHENSPKGQHRSKPVSETQKKKLCSWLPALCH
jgi:hypothetical protein